MNRGGRALTIAHMGTTWPVAPITAGGSGNDSGTTISGSSTGARAGGEDVTSWSFRIDP